MEERYLVIPFCIWKRQKGGLEDQAVAASSGSVVFVTGRKSLG